MNAHDSILNAILAAIGAAPALAGGALFKNRLRKLPEGNDQAVVVHFGSSSPSRGAIRGAPVDWTTRVIVECYAREDNLDVAGESNSLALHRDVYDRLMADPSLGGLAMDLIDPELDTDADPADTDLACVIAQYTVLHRTDSHTLQAPP